MAEDVTDKVELGYCDDDYLRIIKCVCGYYEGFTIDNQLDRDDEFNRCPKCNKAFWFKIHVYMED